MLLRVFKASKREQEKLRNARSNRQSMDVVAVYYVCTTCILRVYYVCTTCVLPTSTNLGTVTLPPAFAPSTPKSTNKPP